MAEGTPNIRRRLEDVSRDLGPTVVSVPKRSRASAIVGRIIANVLDFGLLGLAAVAVDGWLRWAIVAYLAFVGLGFITTAAVQAEKR